jgi:hypothetical protein
VLNQSEKERLIGRSFFHSSDDFHHPSDILFEVKNANVSLQPTSSQRFREASFQFFLNK